MNTTNSKKNKFTEIKEFFQSYDFETPWPENFRLDKCTKVFDLKLFVEAHISFLDANSGKSLFLPYFKRLETVYEYLKKQ